MAGKKLTTRRHFLKSLALGSVFISYWPCHMRMAIASEHTNQHKFDMAVYLFDEKRWYEENVNTYADSIKGAVTDLIVMVYGHYAGGTMGWKSSLIPHISWGAVILGNQLTVLISAMHSRGIRVHAAFNTCRVDATRGLFPPHQEGSKFVDVHNPEFQEFISDLTADCAGKGVDGICLDFVRTDHTLIGGVPADGEKNAASIETIVRMIYEKVKAVKPDCIVSSTTVPWLDITHPQLIRQGRKAINWANAGIQDIIFGFEYGIPPNPEVMQFDAIRALITTNVPYYAFIGCYDREEDGTAISQTSAQFQSVLDAVSNEETIGIYTGWLFTNEHAALTAARAVPEPAPEPEPKPVPPTSPLFIQRKNVGRQSQRPKPVPSTSPLFIQRKNVSTSPLFIQRKNLSTSPLFIKRKNLSTSPLFIQRKK